MKWSKKVHKKLMKIKEFPNFTKFEYSVVDEYLGYYRQLLPYCDLSVDDLFIWQDFNNDLQISTLHGNAVLKYSDIFNDGQPTIVVVGCSNADSTIEEIFSYQEKNGLPKVISNVPKEIVNNISREYASLLNIDEDQDNSDYIYSVDSGIEMTGSRYSHLRRKIRKFSKDFGDITSIRNIDLSDGTENKMIADALSTWKKIYASSQETKLALEGPAILKHLRVAMRRPVYCLGLFIHDRLVAFSIYHLPPQSGYSICNHIKCNYEYSNMFDFMYFQTLLDNKRRGVRYINGEQDLGNPGLRTHKQSLLPYTKIIRYRISAKN